MTKNLGTLHRGLRVLAAALAGACAVFGPWAPAVRYGVFGAMAGYLLWTALVGSCIGLRLLGKATCATRLDA